MREPHADNGTADPEGADTHAADAAYVDEVLGTVHEDVARQAFAPAASVIFARTRRRRARRRAAVAACAVLLVVAVTAGARELVGGEGGTAPPASSPSPTAGTPSASASPAPAVLTDAMLLDAGDLPTVAGAFENWRPGAEQALPECLGAAVRGIDALQLRERHFSHDLGSGSEVLLRADSAAAAVRLATALDSAVERCPEHGDAENLSIRPRPGRSGTPQWQLFRTPDRAGNPGVVVEVGLVAHGDTVVLVALRRTGTGDEPVTGALDEILGEARDRVGPRPGTGAE